MLKGVSMFRIMKYINRISRIAEDDRARYFEDYNITGYQVSYLLVIKMNPGISQDEMAENLFVNKSTVTRNVSSLIEQGYIYKEEDSKDKRIYRLYPTEKLLEIMPKIRKYLRDWSHDVMQDLTEEEQKQFSKMLMKVSKRAQERLEGNDV